MSNQLEKIYDPKQVENRTYDFWLDGGYFRAEVDSKKTPYTIVMPPPNITGKLHMGHALDCTIQDILTRFKRMQGFSALWLPGTDHASIATEVRIVNAMAEEGLTKEDLGREGFLERAWEWKEEYGGTIVNQLKRMGSSCDWDRLRFTMDQGCNDAVKEAFVRLYKKGQIYRGERLINWCPKCMTSISDAEVEYSEQDGHLWHIRYDLSDGTGSVTIATTRPETMLGDTAVAVHPDDERYKDMIGKMLKLPLTDREIPIVADSYAEIEFGTGAVKITPGHDPNDFEVGLRSGLPIISVLNEDATVNTNGGKFKGMDRYEARKQIVSELEANGHLVSIENHKHNVGECYRCSTTVEPMISTQWFMKMDKLAKPAIKAVKDGKTEFIPARFDKIYYHWMENIRDWCISRQLWWGHRIPAFYCDDCGHMMVSKRNVKTCSKCKSKNVRQDEDVLDTWFSSALWPFSTLGWPNKTDDLEYFYPTDTLVTAYDIIFFWVARMIFSGVEHMKQTPFKTVYIHGLIRDAQGRKMSKSLNNGIDPLELIDKYGADALRFALATGNSPGNDMRFSEDKVLVSRNFSNKLWNATRFILMNLDDNFKLSLPSNLMVEDKWILSKLNNLIQEVTDNIEKFELGLAVQKLYDFIWDIFCDWYIEITKPRLQSGGADGENARQMLVYTMINIVKLLHPFMPFITEEIYKALPHDDNKNSIMVSEWPKYEQRLVFADDEREFERIMDAIKGIRNIRAQMNVPPSKKVNISIETENVETFNSAKAYFEKLASAAEITVDTKIDMEKSIVVVTDSARIFMPSDELVDKEKELARLNKEKAACEKDLQIISSKLNNQGFMSKARPEVIESERVKLQNAQDKLEKIEQSLQNL